MNQHNNHGELTSVAVDIFEKDFFVDGSIHVVLSQIWKSIKQRSNL